MTKIMLVIFGGLMLSYVLGYFAGAEAVTKMNKEVKKRTSR